MAGRKEAYSLLFQPFFLGAAAIVVQLVFFRECFFLFSSNELIYAVFLSFWLIFTGAGAWLASVSSGVRKRGGLFSSLFVCLSVVLWILLPYLRLWLTGEGETASPAVIMTAALIIFAPLCVCSGALFVVFASRSEKTDHVRTVYLADVAGAFSGSLVFFIAIPVFSPFYLMLVFLMLFLVVQWRWPLHNVFLYVSMIVLIAAWFFAEPLQQKGLLPGQDIAGVYEGASGKYLVTRNSEQTNLYSGSSFLYSSDYTAPSEELVHTAMLQHPDPHRVLIVNAFTPKVAEEMAKYRDADVLYLENDRVKTELMRSCLGGTDSGEPRVLYNDVMSYADTTVTRYDVIMVQAAGATSLHDSRYFTRHFFGKMKAILNDNGILLLNWNGGSEYFGGYFSEIISLIRNNAAAEFPEICAIPLSRVYLVVSRKGIVSHRIGELAAERGVESDFVNPFVIDGNLLEGKIKQLSKQLLAPDPMRSGNEPAVFIAGLRQWLDQFRPAYFFIPLIVLLILVMVIAVRNIPYGLMMYGTGFASAGITNLLLLLYVFVSGAVQTGLALFFCTGMAGIAMGSLLNAAIKRGNKMISPAMILLIAVSLSIIFFHDALFFLSAGAAGWMVLLLTFSGGAGTGYVFASLSLMVPTGSSKKAALLFSSDVWGGFTGGLLASLVFIPFLGFSGTAMVIASVMLIVWGVSFYKKNK